jgi:hypothetical protein
MANRLCQGHAFLNCTDGFLKEGTIISQLTWMPDIKVGAERNKSENSVRITAEELIIKRETMVDFEGKFWDEGMK